MWRMTLPTEEERVKINALTSLRFSATLSFALTSVWAPVSDDEDDEDEGDG